MARFFVAPRPALKNGFPRRYGDSDSTCGGHVRLLQEFPEDPALRAERAAAAAVVAILVAMIAFSAIPALYGHFVFRPAHDPVWHGLVSQLVHFGIAHLGLNALSLSVQTRIAQALGRAREVPGVLLFSMFAVVLGLKAMNPALAWYVGMSGALYGLVAWLTLEHVRCARSRLLRLAGAVLCVLIGLKEIAGLWWPAGLGDWMGVPPAPAAHVIGFAGGLVYTALAAIYRLSRSRRTA